MFAFKLFPMPVRLIEKDLISRMKCSLPYSWRGWPKISWTSQTIFNQNINSWVTWDSVISHFYVNSSKKGQHSCVTQLSRSVIDFLLKLAVSINYHFTKLKKFKSTHDTVILWTSKSYKLRRRPSQWSENSIVLVHWRFFRLAKEYLSRMPKLESAELLHLRKTNVGHKVNIPHASVFRFTNIFIDESKRFMPGAYLQTYRGFPVWFSVIVAVLSFGGAATLTGAIIFLIFGFPFITIYWQNEQVNRKSLPLVKKPGQWRMIYKRSTLCTRWLSKNSKRSRFLVTIWKLASLRQPLENLASRFFTLQLFRLWIKQNVSLASCSASSCFSLCTILSSFFCIL